MFSSTTTASSITIPTISVSASIVIWLSVKPIAAIKPNVAMIEVGMAMAAMKVERILQRKTKTTMAARMLPSTRCRFIECRAALMKIVWSPTI